MKYIFLGSTNFGGAILESLVANQCVPEAIFSIPRQFSISYNLQSPIQVTNYDFYNCSLLAKQHKIPLYWVERENSPINTYVEIIRKAEVDFLLVAGWYYKIPPSVYSLSKLGAFGFHNSLLPKYAGGAPLVWAIINGEIESGVSLFRMSEKMDSGDILMQESFLINKEDSIKECLQKAKQCAINMSLRLFEKDYKITFKSQDSAQEYYPQRTPSDGEINLNWDSKRLYDFIRAQSSPYPGAFIKTSDGKKLIIDKAHIENICGGGGNSLIAKKIPSLLAWHRRVA